MPDTTTKALVVDDSSLMRLLVADILREDEGLSVIGTAQDGKEAVEKTLELRPDVVVLDVVMKGRDGLWAVREIMERCPTPIVMLSAAGNANPSVIVDALAAGAYAFVNKPQSVVRPKIRQVGALLVSKVKQAASADVKKIVEQARMNARRSDRGQAASHVFDRPSRFEALLVGASTGGTTAVESFLRGLPPNFPLPIVIAQHMPEEFLDSLALRLHNALTFNVRHVTVAQAVQPQTVYLASGKRNTILTRRSGNLWLQLTDEQFEEFNNPSVDALMLSGAKALGAGGYGIILTGMGRDGAKGLAALSEAGGHAVAQDEASSVIYGMPRAAVKTGRVHAVVPIKEMAMYVVSSL